MHFVNCLFVFFLTRVKAIVHWLGSDGADEVNTYSVDQLRVYGRKFIFIQIIILLVRKYDLQVYLVDVAVL